MEFIKGYINAMAGNPIVGLVVVMILFDTVFGCFRAGKDRELNSSFGIDGGLRKVCMLASIAFLGIIDLILGVNLIGFVPKDYLAYISIQQVGTMEFFGFLYAVYEMLSVLKNMRLMGMPLPEWLKGILDKLLTDLTKEMTNDEGAE